MSIWKPSEGIINLGLENTSNFVTNGILLDMVKFFGDPNGNGILPADTMITANDIKGAIAQQGETISIADVVIIHTGWGKLVNTNSTLFFSKEHGIDWSAAEFLTSLKVLAIGSDNWGVAFVEDTATAPFSLHAFLL